MSRIIISISKSILTTVNKHQINTNKTYEERKTILNHKMEAIEPSRWYFGNNACLYSLKLIKYILGLTSYNISRANYNVGGHLSLPRWSSCTDWELEAGVYRQLWFDETQAKSRDILRPPTIVKNTGIQLVCEHVHLQSNRRKDGQYFLHSSFKIDIS